ncbi:conserved hypothetical protein [Paenibacillus curdlanolyticus YK9]|uniref:Pullulanase n=1 Tax=Paenibacillus curdlanolyticus YK9 TaxID=717606 RepID=E0I630_9BACL|nr:DUF6509 family protein [Paenibacillus curdlanolyticus]EFM12422.1 conserved hypothetical protein [Paenibacillus curdlanolyticus YK9]
MLTITEYSVEFVKDPFGILAGKRYEFILDLDVPDDDELYEEQGVYARVIYSVEEAASRIVRYELRERATDRYLEIELEDEELAVLADFCREQLESGEIS